MSEERDPRDFCRMTCPECGRRHELDQNEMFETYGKKAVDRAFESLPKGSTIYEWNVPLPCEDCMDRVEQKQRRYVGAMKAARNLRAVDPTDFNPEQRETYRARRVEVSRGLVEARQTLEEAGIDIPVDIDKWIDGEEDAPTAGS